MPESSRSLGAARLVRRFGSRIALAWCFVSVPMACAHAIESEFGLDGGGPGTGGQAGTLPSTTLGGSGSTGGSGTSSTDGTGGAGTSVTTTGLGGSSNGGASGTGGGSTGGGGSGGSSGAGQGGSGGMDGGTGGTTVRDAGPPIVVDDSVTGTGQNQFNYSAGPWNHCNPCTTMSTPPLYMTTNSWAGGTDAGANEFLTFAFMGTQIVFHGVKDPKNGIGAVSIDGGGETMVDFFSATRAGDQPLWTSPVLAVGGHTFKLRATHTKNPSSTGTTITVDRVDVIR